MDKLTGSSGKSKQETIQDFASAASDAFTNRLRAMRGPQGTPETRRKLAEDIVSLVHTKSEAEGITMMEKLLAGIAAQEKSQG